MKIILSVALGLLVASSPVFSEDAAKPKKDPAEVFAKKDKDSNGSLSKTEFTANAKDNAKAEANFAKKDKNKDGSVSLEEFTGKAKTDPE
ncbi:MAG: hypothetical protein SFU53_12085 [Terrimicrobiaceae bacterium]|nr:hypothetical protein [Terrimicrobiaceae bacterium]